ncbi:MAG: ABC transporter ATP-binding protein [Myxococcales bacterium]|nr:ABC transporter ATP-binding protein [Myxococcales bacterium]
MSAPVIDAKSLSKWYGPVLGVSEITWNVSGGVVGLLGPNGAGKSTFMKMVAGLMRPSRGSIKIFGDDPFSSTRARSRIAYCPEHEQVYGELTAIEFVTAMARLSGVPKAKQAAEAALVEMGLEKSMGRKIAGFSKGMRQRAKLATCIVHNPDLVVLDEPLTGIDPLERRRIVERVKKMAEDGKTVLISSHVLYEIEAITEEIMVIYRGQVLAEGNLREIRGLIDKHPHRIRVECNQPRVLARSMASAEHVVNMEFSRDHLVVETESPNDCYDLIATTCLEEQIKLRAMSSPDNNLSALFDTLTGDRA